MKSYPTISTKIKPTQIYAFDKIDGSNLRVEWSDKQGFYKFGSRNRRIDENTHMLGESVNLMMDNFANDLAARFFKNRWNRTVAFFEFHGENSFCGSHEDEEHKLTLIDVNVYKRGILEPAQFVGEFGELEIPKVLHWGMITEELIDGIGKKNAIQGFLDSKGNFHNREKAYEIAFNNGQIVKSDDKGTLYSEDLY